jgi:hypothetical protein
MADLLHCDHSLACPEQQPGAEVALEVIPPPSMQHDVDTASDDEGNQLQCDAGNEANDYHNA